eukprot:15345135-Ditylum_brightwellii.AAC.1
MNAATFVVQKTGMFREALQKWKAKLPADKTWTNFKKFFAEEYSKLKEEEQLTAKESGFHQANVIESVSQPLENLANAAIANRNATLMLVSANKELTECNKMMAEQVKRLGDKYTQLNEMLKQNDGQQPRGRTPWPKIQYDPHGYCWSCGFLVKRSHNSVTCPNKKDGHQEAATCSNT